MDWKFYANYVKEHPIYQVSKTKTVGKEYNQKARKFKHKYGFDYGETYNLDGTIATFILPRLAFLRDNKTGWHPEPEDYDENGHIINEEESIAKYNKKLDTIIEAFYLYLTKDNFDWTEEDKQLWQEGMKLFVEEFMGFWD